MCVHLESFSRANVMDQRRGLDYYAIDSAGQQMAVMVYEEEGVTGKQNLLMYVCAI